MGPTSPNRRKPIARKLENLETDCINVSSVGQDALMTIGIVGILVIVLIVLAIIFLARRT
jgi:uncharacterized membrane protein